MRSLVALALLAAVTGLAAAPSFRWPVAEGWKPETMPFPLEFAKDLPYAGVEELRFSPGMFKPETGGFWSYAFLWWLDGHPELGQAELEPSLKRYFQGLATEVGKEKGFPIDPRRFSASLHAEPGPAKKDGHTVRAFAGTIDSYDAFVTGKPIVLNVEIWVWDCGEKRAALVLTSPQERAAPIWGSLGKRRDEFHCH